ncbi:hypothetical protein D9M68_762930 [compost metagenome]
MHDGREELPCLDRRRVSACRGHADPADDGDERMRQTRGGVFQQRQAADDLVVERISGKQDLDGQGSSLARACVFQSLCRFLEQLEDVLGFLVNLGGLERVEECHLIPKQRPSEQRLAVMWVVRSKGLVPLESRGAHVPSQRDLCDSIGVVQAVDAFVEAKVMLGHELARCRIEPRPVIGLDLRKKILVGL